MFSLTFTIRLIAITAWFTFSCISTFAADVFHTSQRHFRVPFEINPNGRKLIEIQVFKSNDLGKTWQLLSRLNPNAKEFVYKTNRDEQVWFSLKSLDRDQRVYPAGPAKPDVRVIVDTQKPQLNIGLQSDAAGRVVTSLQSSDKHIDPRTLKVEYQSGRNGDWNDAGVKAGKQPRGEVYHDQVAWWPRGVSGQLLVRVSIADFAGNRTESVQQVTISGQGQLNQQILSQNSGAASLPISTTPPSPSQFKTVSSGSLSETVDQYSPSLQSSVNRSQGGSDGSSSIAWKSETIPAHQSTIAATTTTTKPNTNTQQSVSPDGNMVVSVGSTHPKIDSNRTNKVPATSVSSSRRNSITPATHAQLMEAARPTNSSKFLLTYNVDAIAPQDIKEVGLWITADGGRSWRKWGIDSDHQSPFAVEVPQEGIYGFRIVVSSNEGLNSRIPRAGDSADMWVRYDATRPSAKITSAPYGRGPNAGKLIINWQASDRQLMLRPITLSYSSRPEGPWTSIASDLRNTGSYVWKVPQSVPDNVYLQLKVIDTAGNVTLDQPRQPINVANLVPRGRINGLQPLRPDNPTSQPKSNHTNDSQAGIKNVQKQR